MDKRDVQALLAALTAITGALLMIYMMVTESEPGAIPLLLIGGGAGWLWVRRARGRSHPE